MSHAVASDKDLRCLRSIKEYNKNDIKNDNKWNTFSCFSKIMPRTDSGGFDPPSGTYRCLTLYVTPRY